MREQRYISIHDISASPPELGVLVHSSLISGSFSVEVKNEAKGSQGRDIY